MISEAADEDPAVTWSDRSAEFVVVPLAPRVDVARVFGVHRHAVATWMRAYRRGGPGATLPRPDVRPGTR
jgi:transposase-like protein